LILTDPFFPLSLWERVRVRGFNETLGTLTPRPLPVGEGARAVAARTVKYMLMLY
jgi:hypothetical protein